MMVTYAPETRVLANITIDAVEPQLPAQLRTIADMGKAVAQKKVTFSEMPMNEMMAQMDGSAGMKHGMGKMGSMECMSQSQMMMSGMFYVNGKSFDMARVDMTSKVGEIEEWLLITIHTWITHFTYTAHSSKSSRTSTTAKPPRLRIARARTPLI